MVHKSEIIFTELKKNIGILKYDIADSKDQHTLSNREKRYFYACSELLKIKFDDLRKVHEDVQLIDENIADLKKISDQLNLSFVSHGGSFLTVLFEKIDEFLRFTGVWTCIIVGAVFLAVPSIIIKQLDYYLLYRGIISPFQQFSVLAKRFMNYSVLALSGISLVVDGMELDYFGKSCVITCFSHSSTMDAFILSYVIPTRHYTICKKDLFLIPFFAWLMIAYDGLPIDRSNIESASQCLTTAAENAQLGDCLCMAPEGTRTKTGQLIGFKKGPFYVWEKLKTDIVPIVVFGAYELYPPGKQMTIPGRVHVRVLPPVHSSAADTREEMSQLLRTKMLEAIIDSPEEAGQALSWRERARNVTALIIMFTLDYLLYRGISIFFFDYLKWSIQKTFVIFIIYTIVMTFLLYFYACRLVVKKTESTGNLKEKKLI